MTCKDLMTPDPICCVAEDTVVRAAKFMKTEVVGSIPICEDRSNKRLVGIVTDRDLALKVIAEGRDCNQTKIGDVMTRRPVTCQLDDDVQEVFEAMENNRVRRIPVIDSEGRLCGIIAQADIATRCHQPQKTAEVVETISMG